jgi:hypothetical protein
MNSRSIRIELIGSLVDLVNNCSTYNKTNDTDLLILQVLKSSDMANDSILNCISLVNEENRKIVPYLYPAITSFSYRFDVEDMEADPKTENIRKMKVSLMQGLQEIASNIFEAYLQGTCDHAIIDFIYKGLEEIGYDNQLPSLNATIRELQENIERSRVLKFSLYHYDSSRPLC